MVRRIGIGVVAGLIMVACSPTRPATFGTHDPDLRAPLGRAVERWARATGWDLRVSSNPMALAVQADLPEGLAGTYSARARLVMVAHASPRFLYELILVHEVGHAIAAPSAQLHTDFGVMAPALGWSNCITPEDVKLICQGRCPKPRAECP